MLTRRTRMHTGKYFCFFHCFGVKLTVSKIRSYFPGLVSEDIALFASIFVHL